MKPLHRIHPKEQGISLLIAMIALVVISLAAAALIRTVDTATIISGNLAFKQSATTSGENAVIQANKWITDNLPTADMPGNGFYATTSSMATTNGYSASMSHYSMMSNDATWAAGKSAGALVADCYGNMTTNIDCSGNQIRYIIERMCKNPGAADESHCLLGAAPAGTGSRKVSGIGAGGAGGEGPPPTAGSPVYRITARIVGPRNTVSYIQTFVY
ncbi:Tfp pilus assembly protein PilX [Formivibrio citricus]|uniref:Tfp pilus assembly protein PilX n=1 Tax=Formivibrio citricus TaxID=83765 RepID=A0A1I4ZFJ2_9NEIS|nr:hypothetical protein [Formivibrio citricus]SFN49034.1 Tfp pilus assembly protein PilX [Formivibrio citricus]